MSVGLYFFMEFENVITAHAHNLGNKAAGT